MTGKFSDVKTNKDLPKYFLRNFHYQTDGYLSEKSARLYEFQVETLFSGCAATMRRFSMIPLIKFIKEVCGDDWTIKICVTNAEALSKQLNNRGFPNAGIIGKNENGLIRVAVDSFYTEDEAHVVLNDIKKQLSSAWVLNQN